MAKSDPPDERKRELVESLTVEERAALPSHLRALTADKATVAWNQAKAERDARLEAAYAHVDPADPESDYVIEDPEERAAAAEAARATWAEFKASALGADDRG